tara:strand:+ start:1413 stop:2582 length:1170 start_codon:yes stop_codon:yes gene_type:complete
MPAKSKQQQKFFGVVKAMQKGDIPKKGEAGEVADDMNKKEVDKMASTKHKGLPKKIKEMVEEELQALNEVKPFVDNRLRTKWDYPKGNRDGLVYLATNDKRYPTEIVLYNQKRDVFHFVYSHSGEFTAGNTKTQTVPRKGFNSTHYVMPYFEEWEEDLGYERGFYEAKLPDEGFSDPDQMREAKSANALRSDYEKAVKKEQSLSSLLLVNLEKYKAAKANGNETAIAKHTKIAATLSKKKIDATEKASKAYKVYQDKITGLHADAELELKEIEANDDTEFTITLKHLLDKHVAKGGEVNEALPNFKTPFEAYDWIMNKRNEAMDIEMEMLQKTKEIIQTQKDMEQEAEPEGGPEASRYSKILEKLQMEHESLRKQFSSIMAEIDEYDQN